MILIKSFQLLIILFGAVCSCELILHDYGNGNKGVGVDDQVRGKNNTWIGDSNTINGDVNKVKGNENHIQGSNNIVEGNGNVVGNMSPEQISNLQNQMFASFQERFKGMFNFNSPKPALQKESSLASNSVQPSKQQNIVDNNSKTETQTHQVQTHPNQATLEPKQVPISTNSKIQTVNPSNQEAKDRSMLIFRSYGKFARELIHQEIYNIQENLSKYQQEVLCKRWNYCLHTNRNERWSFNSVYPPFAQN